MSTVTAGIVNVDSTIISDNVSHPLIGRDDFTTPATGATVTVNINKSAIGDVDGYSQSSGSRQPTAANSTFAALKLGSRSVGINGGTTLAYTLGTGSTAIGTGSNPGGVTTDQTGAPRALSGNDMGVAHPSTSATRSHW